MRLRTYIINLKDRIDRKQHILQEFAKYPEFDISIFNAIKAKSGAHGLFQSVKAIIRQAQKAKDKYVIICEDDHIFTDQYNYEELVSLIKTGVMSDFDILLGGPSNIHDAFLIDEKLAWLSGFSGTQFIIIFERFYSIILKYNLSAEANYDLELGKISENIYCCSSPISTQKNFGYSDITSKNNILDVETYFKNCRFKLDRLIKITEYFKNKERNNLTPDKFRNSTLNIRYYQVYLENITKQTLTDSIKKSIESQAEYLVISLNQNIPKVLSNTDLASTLHIALELNCKLFLFETNATETLLPINNSLFWIDHFTSSNLFAIHRSIYENIFNELNISKKSIMEILSDSTSNKLLLYPMVAEIVEPDQKKELRNRLERMAKKRKIVLTRNKSNF